jgi:metallo-beta-lactamase family protein
MLPDSAHIQEQDAEWENRKRLRAGKEPIEPLYSGKDAEKALELFRPASYGKEIPVLTGITARFSDAGHLLGSASIEIWAEENQKTVKLAFSGDIGRVDRPIINDPVSIDTADVLVVEGTYGDRNHEVGTDEEKTEEFAGILERAIRRGGNIVIPSFAVGRTQELLYYIKRLLRSGRVPGLEKMRVFVDSPLSVGATEVYEGCSKGYYDKEAMEMAKDGSPFGFPALRFVETSEESKEINKIRESSIIISSSGMCDAGRIRHHLKHNLYRADATVIFSGYQAEGTLGRMLTDGLEKVKLFGEEIRVNAAIEKLEGFSGHAGKDELLAWIRALDPKPKKVFLVHGEGEVLDSYASSVRSLGYSAVIPKLGEEFDLENFEALAPEAQMDQAPETEVHAAAAPKPCEICDRIEKETERIQELVQRAAALKSPDVLLKFAIMEEDVRSLTDKWEKILG